MAQSIEPFRRASSALTSPVLHVHGATWMTVFGAGAPSGTRGHRARPGEHPVPDGAPAPNTASSMSSADVRTGLVRAWRLPERLYALCHVTGDLGAAAQPSRPPGRGADGLRALSQHRGAAALQKGPEQWVHRDELLFQVVHQSSELWLKLAWNDTAAAADARRRGTTSVRRCVSFGVRACACASSPASSTCSSRCRRGSTRRSARCSGTAPASTRPA